MPRTEPCLSQIRARGNELGHTSLVAVFCGNEYGGQSLQIRVLVDIDVCDREKTVDSVSVSTAAGEDE